MIYVDNLVLAVPTERRDAYLRYAREAAAFHDHGALRVVETWGDDVPEGKWTDFRRAVALDPGATVVVGWIEWPNRAARDTGWKAVMTDPRMATDGNPMPFDGKGMVYGGFQMLLDARADAEAAT